MNNNDVIIARIKGVPAQKGTPETDAHPNNPTTGPMGSRPLTTWQNLLNEFVSVRATQYRDDPEEAAARMKSIEYTIQTMLEKLRVLHDPH